MPASPKVGNGDAIDQLIRGDTAFNDLFDPKHGLGDSDVALHFGIGGIRREFAPKFEIGFIGKGPAGEQKIWLAGWPAVPCLHIRFKRPFGFVCQVRIEIFDRLGNAAASGSTVGPEILIRSGEQDTKSDHVVELED